MFAMLLLLAVLPIVELPDLEMLALRADLNRFPTANECSEWIERADKHLLWIDAQTLFYPEDRRRWQIYRQQVAEWRGVWTTLRIARSQPIYLTDRERLECVRASIGEWNYHWGYVPPPIASYLLDTLAE